MTKNRVLSRPLKKQTMAEQMAETVEELIISGQLIGGAALPTEPELAEQFGVSRAVVRDATRILMARGLVEVKHGRGVFVTEADNDAFAEALLLALRRAGASAWDVEQFEQLVFPEVVALAATQASGEELAAIRHLIEDYLATIAAYHDQWSGKTAPPAERDRLVAAYRQIMQAIFAATHNKVLQQLARPLLRLRNLRQWAKGEDSTPQDSLAVETHHFQQFLAALESQDADQARAIVSRVMVLPPEAVAAMRQTPVGEVTEIPVPLPKPTDL